MGKELSEALERIKTLEDMMKPLQQPLESVEVTPIIENKKPNAEDLKNANQLISSEINPEALREAVNEAIFYPEKYLAKYPGRASGSVYINSEIFVAMLEMARLMSGVMKWNRKGRLVLEYDPEQAKFVFSAIREDDVSNAEGAV